MTEWKEEADKLLKFLVWLEENHPEDYKRFYREFEDYILYPRTRR